MLKVKICPICGKEFTVPRWREEKAKYCSTACRQESLKAKDNINCDWCGSPFHMKKYQMVRYKRTMGYFCCKECANSYKSRFMSGEGNHQYGLIGESNASFRGLEIEHKNHSISDTYVYYPEHPKADSSGRVAKHRLIAEQNANKFGLEFFDLINGFFVLKDIYVVHHKDGNHKNDDVDNLEIMTRGAHTSHHNKTKQMVRDKSTGRFVKRN